PGASGISCQTRVAPHCRTADETMTWAPPPFCSVLLHFFIFLLYHGRIAFRRQEQKSAENL
ncbi:hypothetical protein, partial [Mitsuokella jalaludinii]|uniref:hypothetical protein n=1 Tax=Mitsuokella jalaludinii TaxID=187979 RepID=UPI00307FC544